MKKSIYSFSLFLAGLFLIGQQALAQNPDPEVTVIQPDKKNIEWVIGETYLISWTDNFVNTVDIYLVDYTTNPAGVDILIDEDIEGSTYEWFIDPDDFGAGDHYKVRVQSSVNSIYEDDSRWEFSLVTSASNATIKVEQPNVRNIEWIRGYEYLISWTDNIEDPLDIYLVIDATYNADPTDETHWIEIETAVEGSTYTWDIWDTLSLRNDYRVLVTDENREEKDLSDRTFSIVETGGTITVLQPNVRNIEWIYGNEYLISWNRTTTGTFDLYLIKDYSDWSDATPFDPVDLIEIETDVEGTTYSWEIDDAAIEALVPGNEFRIMVKATDSDIYDISNKDFSIVAYSGFIQVEQPNVRNISWILGTDHLISWLDNIDSDMDIFLVNDVDYDDDNPATHVNKILIEDDVPGTTYTWEIDPTLPDRDDYRILIATPDFSIRDLSNKTFSLVENIGDINVIQPNVSGIKWVRENEYLLSWTSSALGTVDLYLVDYSEYNNADPFNAAALTEIDTDVENSTYTWEIPNTIAPAIDYRLLVKSHTGDIYDISNKNFEIALSGGGDLDFNLPTSSSVWYRGLAYMISWDDDIMEPLDIYLKNDNLSPAVDILIADEYEGSTIIYNVPSNSATVPNSGNYYIQIVSSLDGSMVFPSDQFTITEEVLAAIFPNPASQYFNVQFDEQMDGVFDVTIFDRFNNRMLETRLDAATKQHRISTATLPEGFYFVQMVSGDKTITKKIVVKH